MLLYVLTVWHFYFFFSYIINNFILEPRNSFHGPPFFRLLPVTPPKYGMAPR
jgi:hypothetical protein